MGGLATRGGGDLKYFRPAIPLRMTQDFYRSDKLMTSSACRLVLLPDVDRDLQKCLPPTEHIQIPIQI
jgi:hypothetical protein